MIATAEIFWAAGFIDGEGCFSSERHCPVVSAVQKERWPLDRLQRLFGGFLRQYRKGGDSASRDERYWQWKIYGGNAAGVMMTLFREMSPRRQARIVEVLDRWKTSPKPGAARRAQTHCKRGHELSGDNLRVKPNGIWRECKACQESARQQYLARKRSLASKYTEAM